jgi:hypothetical protein
MVLMISKFSEFIKKSDANFTGQFLYICAKTGAVTGITPLSDCSPVCF